MLKTKRFASPVLLAVYLSMTFAIVFILYSVPTSIAQTTGPTNVQNYENPSYGIKIQYPKDPSL